MQQCAQFAGEPLQNRCPEMRTGISDGIYPGFQKDTAMPGTVIMWYVPGVTLYGEQLDSHLTSLAATEVEKAEVLLLLRNKIIFGCVLKLCQIF